jgi:YVTN family beta-propeller protein
MIASRSATLCGVASLFISLGIAAQERPTYQVGPQVDGSYVTPANQIVTPAGTQVHFNGRPMAIAIRPDQKTAAVLVAGGGYNLPTLPIAIVDLTAGTVKQEFNPGTNNGSYDGLIYSPDGTHLYFSQDTGRVIVANVAADGTLALNTTIHLPAPTGPTPVGSVAGTVNNGGLALSGDGKFLYVVENMVNAVAVIDLSTDQISTVIPVQNAPASIVVVGKSAYVTNQGGRPPKPGEYTDLSAGTPIVADPEAAFSLTGTVSVIDLKENVVTKNIHVGLQPTAILAANGYVYVANTNSDSISVIDGSSNEVVETTRIRVFEDAPLGSFPNALAFTSRGELAVSLGGNNAVALYRTNGGRKLEFEGFIPTAWYPAAVAVAGASSSSSLSAADKLAERLLIGNAKGTAVGSEVPGTSNPPGKNTHSFVGSVSVVALPEADDFRKYDAQVAANNGWKRHEESG